MEHFHFARRKKKLNRAEWKSVYAHWGFSSCIFHFSIRSQIKIRFFQFFIFGWTNYLIGFFFSFASFGVSFFYSISTIRSIFVSFSSIHLVNIYRSTTNLNLNLQKNEREKNQHKQFFSFGISWDEYNFKQRFWFLFFFSVFRFLMHCTCFTVQKCLQAWENKKVAWIVSFFLKKKGVSDIQHKQKKMFAFTRVCYL